MKKLLLFLLPFILFAQKPKLLLLKVYRDQNITGWVMSEKLDGIRAYWNGKMLLTRNGNIIYAPSWFTKDFPPFELDGELWSKRGEFDYISSVIRKSGTVYPEDWDKITYNIFEVPNAKGVLFERLSKVKAYESRIIKIIPQLKVKSKKDLKRFLKEVEKQGGEGVVVRDPNTSYITGRSNRALKVKSFLDSECKVIAHNRGHGKFSKVLGSITCRLDNNITFKIGSGFSLKERKNPPPIGSTVTFKYKEFTKYGKPRFPVFLRVK